MFRCCDARLLGAIEQWQGIKRAAKTGDYSSIIERGFGEYIKYKAGKICRHKTAMSIHYAMRPSRRLKRPSQVLDELNLYDYIFTPEFKEKMTRVAITESGKRVRCINYSWKNITPHLRDKLSKDVFNQVMDNRHEWRAPKLVDG